MSRTPAVVAARLAPDRPVHGAVVITFHVVALSDETQTRLSPAAVLPGPPVMTYMMSFPAHALRRIIIDVSSIRAANGAAAVTVDHVAP